MQQYKETHSQAYSLFEKRYYLTLICHGHTAIESRTTNAICERRLARLVDHVSVGQEPGRRLTDRDREPSVNLLHVIWV